MHCGPLNTQLMGSSVAFLPYGNTWRAHRRLYQQGFSSNVVRDAGHVVLTEKTNRFLDAVVRTPNDFRAHIELYVTHSSIQALISLNQNTHRLVGAVVLKYIYGRDIDRSDDPMFAAAIRAAEAVLPAGLPGAWLVNSLPSLQRLPRWFPGCYFHDFTREIKQMSDDMVEQCYEDAVKDTVGRPTSCCYEVVTDLCLFFLWCAGERLSRQETRRVQS